MTEADTGAAVRRLQAAARHLAEQTRGRALTGRSYQDADDVTGTASTDDAIGFDPLPLLRALDERGAKVAVIGQVAGIMHGSRDSAAPGQDPPPVRKPSASTHNRADPGGENGRRHADPAPTASASPASSGRCRGTPLRRRNSPSTSITRRLAERSRHPVGPRSSLRWMFGFVTGRPPPHAGAPAIPSRAANACIDRLTVSVSKLAAYRWPGRHPRLA